MKRRCRDTFRPEFLNRIDEIIIFEPLTLAAVEQMVDLQIRELAERMDESGLAIHLTEPARHWLARQGYDPQFGARPLRRAIQRHIENPLSIHLLQGEFSAGDLVVISEEDDQLEFSRHRDQASDYAGAAPAPQNRYENLVEEGYPAREYYDAEYEDDDYADFLSQTDDDDEFDAFRAALNRPSL